jgi:VanZ family protein
MVGKRLTVRGWRGVASLVGILSLFVLFLPGDDVPSGFPGGTDKLVHFTLFAALAITVRLSGLRSRWVITLLTGYAVASELIQAVPVLRRDATPWDALADVIGVVAGVWIARWPR